MAAWLEGLGEGPLALLEAGPGEGSLAADLAGAMAAGWPQLAERTTMVLLEPNPG
ncbi:MAG: SAM-dependent methyltransferase, partial [Cyanobium sp.]